MLSILLSIRFFRLSHQFLGYRTRLPDKRLIAWSQVRLSCLPCPLAKSITRTCRRLLADFPETRQRTGLVEFVRFPETCPKLVRVFVCPKLPRDKSETSHGLLSRRSFGEVRVMEFGLNQKTRGVAVVEGHRVGRIPSSFILPSPLTE